MLHSQKIYFTLLIFSVISVSAFSQAKIESKIINNKNYYVYPKRASSNLMVKLKPTKIQEEKELKKFYEENQEQIPGLTLENAQRMYKTYYGEINPTKYQKIIIEKNPLYFVENSISFNNELEPSLDPLPDGDYIQYFKSTKYRDDLPNVTEGLVASYFSLKNNQIEGMSYWLDAFGDTLLQGNYKNGLKDGVWHFWERDYAIRDVSKKTQSEAMSVKTFKRNEVYKKTLAEAISTKTFKRNEVYVGQVKNGLKDGAYSFIKNGITLEKGFHSKGNRSGEWFEYGIIPDTSSMNIKDKMMLNFFLDNNYSMPDSWYKNAKSVVLKHYIYPKEPILSHKKLFREDLSTYEYERALNTRLYNKIEADRYLAKQKGEKYKPSPADTIPFNFTNSGNIELRAYEFYKLKQANITVDGETMDGELEDEEYEEQIIYSNNAYYGDYLKYEEKTAMQLQDSLGYYPTYELFESFYNNGQKQVRLDFKDGNLVKEDTVFFKNSRPFSVVNFYKDSNQYEHIVYDIYGKLVIQFLYDSIGKEIRQIVNNSGIDHFKYDNDEIKTEIINNLNYEIHKYPGKYYIYNCWDTLGKYNLTEKTTLSKVLDSNKFLVYEASLDPAKRELVGVVNNIFKQPVSSDTTTFSEDYTNYVSNRNFSYNNITHNSHINAGFSTTDHSQYTYYADSVKKKIDSLPQFRITLMNELYETNEVNLLRVNNKPFNGSFNSKIAGSDFKLTATDKQINFAFPQNNDKFINAIRKNLRKEMQGKKTSYHTYFEHCNALFQSTSALSAAADIANIYFPTMENFYNIYNTQYGDLNGYKIESPYSISGNYTNGLMTGFWASKFKSGKIAKSVNFNQEGKSGAELTYDYIYPKPKKKNSNRKNSDYDNEYDVDSEYGGNVDYLEPINKSIFDSLPKSKTYFLSRKVMYTNGKRNGPTTNYHWLGFTKDSTNFLDDEAQGFAFEKSKFNYTEMNYLEGQLDGNTRSWLTIPGKQNVLLYDANFKRGALQGESTSYHPNSKIAKRGFFLDGKPIDDYEAYDTLGKLYQYVKFQYNYPIEEKIYESNQLSVKYDYNWKDSLYFSMDNFTLGEGTEAYLANEGMYDDQMSKPYYGRASLVDKSGINYYMTKYYPNDTISREGRLNKGKKTGCWKYQSYSGTNLYEIDYSDSTITLNDSISFKTQGVYREFDSLGRTKHVSYIIEKNDKYDCSHIDHYETRQFMTIIEFGNPNRMNGYAKNYYDNGSIQSEGMMKNGLPTDIWKFYENDGSLNEVGVYILGKRHGRWLKGDLSKTNYMGDICLNPNLPNLEKMLEKQAQLLDISILIYDMGKIKNKSFFEVNSKEEEK